MSLPFSPPLRPMLAKGAKKIPRTADLLFEPKWDGFRVIVFRDEDDLYLQSRELKPLLRYFPELEAPLKAQLPSRCVLDGELVIDRGGHLDFAALQQRIHPAKSRIDKLADETPASLVVWDVLALGEEDLRTTPFGRRRELLCEILASASAPIHLTPATRDADVAQDWFVRFEGAGLDGVVAKPLGDVYQPGKRAMSKIKHARTVDCVLAGFRWHKSGPGSLIGSFILGLYTDDGRLQQIGVAASFTAKRRAELAEELAPLRVDALDGHPWAKWAEAEAEAGHGGRRPGVQSRWSGGKDLTWEPLRIERVVEVGYNHFCDGRLRHPGHFKRWRPDRSPASCTFEQIEVTPAYELSDIFGPRPG